MTTIAVLFCSFGMMFLSAGGGPRRRTSHHPAQSGQRARRPTLPASRDPLRDPYNFTGKQLYPFPAAFIHKDLAGPLRKVQQGLSRQGMGLKIYDGYRPLRPTENVESHSR